MCGLAGIFSLNPEGVQHAQAKIDTMCNLIRHRGPDDQGSWMTPDSKIVLGHRRLSIIDLSNEAHQPLVSPHASVIVFNGEIYNYKEIRNTLKPHWNFRSQSDTEVILAAYHHYGVDCVQHLRGMFAFAIWDETKQSLFIARDRFGIKPLYYYRNNRVFYFASEVKALIPFMDSIDTNSEALAEYLTFQYTLKEQTLFDAVHQLMPAHYMIITQHNTVVKEYWDVNYAINYDYNEHYYTAKLRALLNDSVAMHLRSDVPVGSYVSGGLDSSLITILANKHHEQLAGIYHGRFTDYPGYDESQYANTLNEDLNLDLNICTITAEDFQNSIQDVIYHLDTPVGGPGSFPQYMVSKLASKHVKVVLGGQGGDELFGGYARYLLAYFEQSIKAAIEGTYQNGNFVVTPESIIPNLTLLQAYKPLIQEFWRSGLFGPLDERYFRLVNRSNDMNGEINADYLSFDSILSRFKTIFNRSNVGKEAYFDKMTHFDFKCLLPALLQVEDRMSMAHGLEARVPFLDHPLVELTATIPADIKFPGGRMKHLLRETFKSVIPDAIRQRSDKMGFPVPLKEWFASELSGFMNEVFSPETLSRRSIFDAKALSKTLHEQQGQFSRKLWGLLSLELWFQTFHDKHSDYKQLFERQCQQRVEIV